jgi:hypothetical protein
MTTFTWTVSQLDCYPQYDNQTDVVFVVHWQLTGTDGTHTGSVYSTCGVTYKADTPFTPYDQLTKNQVLGWIWANGVDKDSAEAAVQTQIDNQINPPTISPPLPWVN